MKNIYLFEEFYSCYVQLNDRFESVHIWSEEIAIKNAGRWIPMVISKEKYDLEKSESCNDSEHIENKDNIKIGGLTFTGLKEFPDHANWIKVRGLDLISLSESDKGHLGDMIAQIAGLQSLLEYKKQELIEIFRKQK